MGETLQSKSRELHAGRTANSSILMAAKQMIMWTVDMSYTIKERN